MDLASRSWVRYSLNRKKSFSIFTHHYKIRSKEKMLEEESPQRKRSEITQVVKKEIIMIMKKKINFQFLTLWTKEH